MSVSVLAWDDSNNTRNMFLCSHYFIFLRSLFLYVLCYEKAWRHRTPLIILDNVLSIYYKKVNYWATIIWVASVLLSLSYYNEQSINYLLMLALCGLCNTLTYFHNTDLIRVFVRYEYLVFVYLPNALRRCSEDSCC